MGDTSSTLSELTRGKVYISLYRGCQGELIIIGDICIYITIHYGMTVTVVLSLKLIFFLCINLII